MDHCCGSDPGANVRRTVGVFASVRVCKAPLDHLDVEVTHCSRAVTSDMVCAIGDDLESEREMYNVISKKNKCKSNDSYPDVSCHMLLNGINSAAGTMLYYSREGGLLMMKVGAIHPFNTFIEEAPILFDCNCAEGAAYLVSFSAYNGLATCDPRSCPENGEAADHGVECGSDASCNTSEIDEGVCYSGERVSTLKNIFTC